MPKRDRGLDTLLGFDGYMYFRTPDLIVKFKVKRCAVSEFRPHGIRYSLTLHHRNGQRLIGIDNAHAVPYRGRNVYTQRSKAYDHIHAHSRDKGRPYIYRDAYELMADFFKAVEDYMERR